MPAPKSKTILVTGDQNPDYDIYLHSDADNPPPGTPPTIVCTSRGGAGIIERVLSQVAQSTKSDAGNLVVRFAAAANPNPKPIYALWQPSPIGSLGKDEKATVWRTKRTLSLGEMVGMVGLAQPVLPATGFVPGKPEDYAADILVIDDNADHFRFNLPAVFKEHLAADQVKLPELVVLKMHSPVCQGESWWALSGSGQLLDRLVVILSVNDLRRTDIRVSQGISWERTAEDLARELLNSSALEGLRRARHVIVTLQSEGALWMERTGEKNFSFRLLFDPAHMESEWSEQVSKKGNAYGFHSAFAAAMAARCAMNENPSDLGAIEEGIHRGIHAMRVLLVLGHGSTKTATPGLPAIEIGALLCADHLESFFKDTTGQIAWKKFGPLAAVTVPGELTAKADWQILESSNSALKGQPLYGKARRVAIFGLKQLGNVPYARFGKYFTADRNEIESLRNLKRLIKAYSADKRETKPLSLAVFGPPGAGKSFGIKQIAETVVDAKEQAFLEFNLSQFSQPEDLIGAFHQVRDRVLEGKLPVVFWDEFDSEKYKWLQFLLAPMQDGKFQEGRLTHPIGKCIFVFAGATSYTCDNFGPPREFVTPKVDNGEPIKDTTEARQRHTQALAEFKLKKGPDFISRLHGSLNVLGPNPRQKFNGNQWEDDLSDVCFPVRRAILLRSLLGLMDEKHGLERLNIDSGLLAALLECGHYKYGSRSFEKIVVSLKREEATVFSRSDLPSDEVLTMNLENLNEFKNLLDESRLFQQYADQLAPAVHAAWFPLAEQQNAYRIDFPKLPAETKGDNYAAVARIPHLLGLVGLRLEQLENLEPGVVPLVATETFNKIQLPKILDEHLNLLAEEEHDLWMQVKLANGWKRPKIKPADKAEQKQQRSQRLHDCLIAYKDLTVEDQKKDHSSILNIPEVARLAGFKIAPKNRPQK